jgi:hypothetical protein
MGVVACGPVSPLVKPCLPNQHRASLAEPLDNYGVICRDSVSVKGRTDRAADACNINVILDRHHHAVKGFDRAPGVAGFVNQDRVLERLLSRHGQKSVHCRLPSLDPLKEAGHYLTDRELAPGVNVVDQRQDCLVTDAGAIGRLLSARPGRTHTRSLARRQSSRLKPRRPHNFTRAGISYLV